jgi:hypothetical protein
VDDRFDAPPPWWVKDAARGGWGGATGLSVYRLWTGDGPPSENVLLSAIVVTLFAWYLTGVARWRQEHRLPPGSDAR